MQRKIPLARSFQLLPRIDFLDRIGAPIERGLERNKLPPGLRERPDMLLSTRAIAAFTGDMAHREGIEDFGWRTTSSGLDQIGPGLVHTLRRSPTLAHALENLCRLGRLESSNLQLWLEERGDALLLCHQSPLEFGALGTDELTTMRTALMIYIMRLFTPSSDWVPTECGFAVQGEIGPLIREQLRGARIQRTPDYGWVRVPRSILALPPRIRLRVEKGAGLESGEEPALDLVGSLVQLVSPYLSDGAPSIREAADLAGTSIRSLQRELTRAGSSYRNVLQRAKFDLARDLLQQPGLKIVEISHATGFKSPPHFTRFFRRFAAMSPREYRAALLQE